MKVYVFTELFIYRKESNSWVRGVFQNKEDAIEARDEMFDKKIAKNCSCYKTNSHGEIDCESDDELVVTKRSCYVHNSIKSNIDIDGMDWKQYGDDPYNIYQITEHILQ